MSPRRRPRRSFVRAGAAAVALGAVAYVGTAAGSGVAAGDVVTTAPLTATWSGAAGTYAVVAAGRLASHTDTFWQLLALASGATDWTLATPPGVASNGGLVADASGSTITSGFEPSDKLAFSPVARSADGGANWSPGIVPGALAAVPDALSSSSGGSALALVRRARGTVLSTTGSLSAWRTLATAGAVASTPGGRACGVQTLTAVAQGAAGPEVGASCAEPGVVGIFTTSSGTWSEAGPAVPAAARAMRASVLRLEATLEGTAALVAMSGRRGVSLVASWRSAPGQPWTSSALRRATGRVIATGEAVGGTFVVVTTTGACVVRQGGGWSDLPALPGHSAAVAVVGTTTWDLALSGRDLTAYTLGATGTWSAAQHLRMPLQYGSST